MLLATTCRLPLASFLNDATEVLLHAGELSSLIAGFVLADALAISIVSLLFRASCRSSSMREQDYQQSASEHPL